MNQDAITLDDIRSAELWTELLDTKRKGPLRIYRMAWLRRAIPIPPVIEFEPLPAIIGFDWLQRPLPPYPRLAAAPLPPYPAKLSPSGDARSPASGRFAVNQQDKMSEVLAQD